MRSSLFFKKKTLCHSFRSRRGQALLEYVLLLVILSGISLTILNVFNTSLSNGILRFNAVLEKELRTGNSNIYPESATGWKN